MRITQGAVWGCLGVAMWLWPQRAEACGGCFIPPAENTVVTGHRMAIAISPQQSILWDQIEYDGNPAEFAWVLPVTEGATLELGTDAWFETLDSATSAQITAPTLNCGGGGGFGFFGPSCGEADSLAVAEGGASSSGGGGVQVLHRGTVGPYETVTLRSTSPTALNDWLEEHNYAIPEEIEPVIASYVGDGWDFIALRLQPNFDVRQMKPVRVIFPGPTFSFPLRMVAAGTGANTAVTIFVIAEGRWEIDGFPNKLVNTKDLKWDFSNSKSDYLERREAALLTNDQMTWLTTYAKQGALFSPLINPTNQGAVFYAGGNSFNATIADAYIAQGQSNGEELEDFACQGRFQEIADSNAIIVDTCNDGVCGGAGAGEIAAHTLKCGALDDIGAALVGMHPRAVWVGRLEANLPRAAFEVDLALQAAESQTPVENLLQATKSDNAPCPLAGTTRSRPPAPPPNPLGPFLLLVVTFAFALSSVRRLSRPSASART